MQHANRLSFIKHSLPAGMLAIYDFNAMCELNILHESVSTLAAILSFFTWNSFDS